MSAQKHFQIPWQEVLKIGIEAMLQDPSIKEHLTEEHLSQTPDRVIRAYEEFFSGCLFDPKEILMRSFEEQNYNELIVVKDIDFVSYCCHHLVPFIGKVHFGYLPNGKVVGLSKIPRLIDVLSHRPQIQERLTSQIVDVFQEAVGPRGCGVVVEANHLCMSIRGIKKANAITKTNALRGEFLKPALKDEFLEAIRRP